MTTSTTVSLRRVNPWLLSFGVCSMLVGLTACDVDPSTTSDAEFRAGPLELDSLEPGECLLLDEGTASATTKKWTLGAGLPKGIIIDDHLLLTSVFEDNVMLRISGPASVDDGVLTSATATAIYNSPELDDPCDGFCDGLCVDGECYMNLPSFAVSLDGVCL